MRRPRQTRLLNEFKLISKMRTQDSLFDFICGRLTEEDAERIERKSYRPLLWEEIVENMPPEYYFPEEYQERFPDQGPEKYLVRYDCTGLVYEQRDKGFDIWKQSFFLVEILYGLDFPVERPVFVCTTKNVWHPNISFPNICLVGRPFPAGVTLEYLIPMIGRMFQWQEYNLESTMNSYAADWADENPDLLPVDDRDILDKNRHLRKLDSPSPSLLDKTSHVELLEPDEKRTTARTDKLPLLDDKQAAADQRRRSVGAVELVDE